MSPPGTSRTSAEIASQPGTWRLAAEALPRLSHALPRRGERALAESAASSAGLDPMADLVLAQRLAVRFAQARGYDPDRPRNLTRSVILGDDRA